MSTYRMAGWLSLLLFGFFTWFSYSCCRGWPALFFFFFTGLGLYLILAAGSFDLDEQSLTHQSAFGRWRIGWNEIVSVEVGQVDGTIVLHGTDKRFILAPPGYWRGVDRKLVLDFVLAQLEARKVPMKTSRGAAYKIMRNTRVT